MGLLATRVKDAERMMTEARALPEGIELTFADGRRGLVPFQEIPEIGGLSRLEELELPNPYDLVLRDRSGNAVELPWDFIRHFCDPAYRPRIEAGASARRRSLGNRIRHLREAAGLTQDALASAAGIGRVTLARIEAGEQSPRYESLQSLARALGLGLEDLVASPVVEG